MEQHQDFAAHVAQVAGTLACLHPGQRAQRTATLWQPGVLITSEQGLPDGDAAVVAPGGARSTIRLAGRDPGTNVAVFRTEMTGPALPAAADPQVGGLALLLGAAEDGSPTARLAMVHRLGPAWDSMAGGLIDRLIRLDGRLMPSDEGGPVLDTAGRLLGMSTLGPRRRALVIPGSTVVRVVSALLSGGKLDRGWLGLGLQPVAIPAGLQQAAGRDAGLMIVSLAPHGPAEQAGVLPGDILLDVDGAPAAHPRAVARALVGGRVGEAAALRLLRAGQPIGLSVTIASRPAA